MSRRVLLLLAGATLSGCAWFLATADHYIWPLAWVASVPLFFCAEQAKTGRRAFFYGWWAGLITNVGGFYWIVHMLVRYAYLHWILAVGIFLLMAAYQATLVGALAAGTRAIRKRNPGLPFALVAPLVMVTVELIAPLIFTYFMAITQVPAPGVPGAWWLRHVIQVADLTGPLGVTALLFMVNGAIYDVITLPARRKRVIVAAAAGGVLLLAFVYGEIRIRQMSARHAAAPKIKVGLVQPNVAFNEKDSGNPAVGHQQMRDLQDRAAELEAQGADLIVWPEASYPDWLDRKTQRDWRPEDLLRRPPEPLPHKPIRWAVVRRDGQLQLEPRFSTPLVMGAVTMTDGDRYPHNSALMLDRDGTFTGRFDKIFLLVFGEYIPFKDDFEFVEKLIPDAAGNMARGKDIVTFPFHTRDGATWRLGPMICYEDILPDFGRKLAALHPHLLVNITNDAWFGDTSEPWQHLALSAYRSVELRTELVRAVNTGVSAYVDATGTITAKTYAVDPEKNPFRDPHGASIIGEVALMEGGHTVYAAVGDLFGWICAAATAMLILVLPRYRRWRARKPS
jgi:apolipoprotein N-acyltransferase